MDPTGNQTPYLHLNLGNDAVKNRNWELLDRRLYDLARGSIANIPAGGDLTGFYPDPIIKDGAMTPNKIALGGDPGEFLTINASGQLVWAVPASTPSGPAGGDLTGNYPNPLIGPGAVGQNELDTATQARLPPSPTMPADSGKVLTVNPGNGALVWTTPAAATGAQWTDNLAHGTYTPTTSGRSLELATTTALWFGDPTTAPAAVRTPNQDIFVQSAAGRTAWVQSGQSGGVFGISPLAASLNVDLLLQGGMQLATFKGASPAAGSMQFLANQLQLRVAGAWQNVYPHPAPGIADAPSDGTLYGRQNAAWTPVPSGGGGGGDSFWTDNATWNLLSPVPPTRSLALTSGQGIFWNDVYTGAALIEDNANGLIARNNVTLQQSYLLHRQDTTGPAYLAQRFQNLTDNMNLLRVGVQGWDNSLVAGQQAYYPPWPFDTANWATDPALLLLVDGDWSASRHAIKLRLSGGLGGTTPAAFVASTAGLVLSNGAALAFDPGTGVYNPLSTSNGRILGNNGGLLLATATGQSVSFAPGGVLMAASQPTLFQVNSGIVVGADLQGASPLAGSIQWAGGHFQGRNASAWVNLDTQGILDAPNDGQLYGRKSLAWAIVPAGGGAPSGPAGGDLAGTYPNPTLTAAAKSKWSLAGSLITPIDATKILSILGTAGADQSQVQIGSRTAKGRLMALAAYDWVGIAINMTWNGTAFVRDDATKSAWDVNLEASGTGDAFGVERIGPAGGSSVALLTVDATGVLGAPGYAGSGASALVLGGNTIKSRLFTDNTSATPYLAASINRLPATGAQDDNTKPSWQLTLNGSADNFTIGRAPAGGALSNALTIDNAGKLACTLADASVTKTMLAPGATVRSGAVNSFVYTLGGNITSTTNVAIYRCASFTASGGTVLVLVNLMGTFYPNVTARQWFAVDVFRVQGAVQIGTFLYLGEQAAGGFTTGYPIGSTLTFKDVPPAGATQYEVQLRVGATTNVYRVADWGSQGVSAIELA